MQSRLISNALGGYRFLPGSDPYSSGVIAEPGHEIVHAVLARPLPWREGLLAARKYLEQQGWQRYRLCGVELRCPEPHPMGGFLNFNQQYHALLVDWEMLVQGQNPIARTNVSPQNMPPSETVLYGFSYVEPSSIKPATFVVAGGGEVPHRELHEKHIVRFGETSAEAMLEKAECVVGIMRRRLELLAVDEEMLSCLNVYSVHPVGDAVEKAIMPGLAKAAHLGIHWFYARPPVQNIEFEMDLRGVRRELVLDLSFGR